MFEREITVAEAATKFKVHRNTLGDWIDKELIRDAVIDHEPTADLDETWSGGFFQPKRFVGFIYDSLVPAEDENGDAPASHDENAEPSDQP